MPFQTKDLPEKGKQWILRLQDGDSIVVVWETSGVAGRIGAVVSDMSDFPYGESLSSVNLQPPFVSDNQRKSLPTV
jgi:hypothetical protein